MKYAKGDRVRSRIGANRVGVLVTRNSRFPQWYVRWNTGPSTWMWERDFEPSPAEDPWRITVRWEDR